jgi:cell wall-associated NlpC family hydrolase
MAPEPTSRPGADVVPVSRDEVRRRIDSLYDRAESDTGRFNATRAAGVPRGRGAAGRDRSQDVTDPTLAAVTRQWFDAARAKLGPTVPVRPAERSVPARPTRAPQAARPAPPQERPAEPLALEAPQAAPSGGSAPTLPTGTLPELAAGSVTPVAAPEPAPEESLWSTGTQPALTDSALPWEQPQPAWAPAPEPTAALPVVEDPAAGSYRSVLPTTETAPYAVGSVADPTATYATDWPTDMTTATYGAGLPTFEAAPFEAAPFPAAAPTALPEPSPAPTAHGGYPQPASTPHGTKVDRVVAFARAQIGRPCVWGAAGPGSYDAPGLTLAAWKAAGVTLPRTARDQSGVGTPVSLADVQVGDLVFFHDDLGHVGIWTGNGMMIHAPGPGATVREESVFVAGQSAIKGAVRPA